MRRCRHEPPTVRSDRRSEQRDPQFLRGICEYGNCMEFRCLTCGCFSGMGWGPMDCPCDDTVGFHDMRRKPRAAIKPSQPTRRRRKTRSLK